MPPITDCLGNGKFVAVADTGQVMTSEATTIPFGNGGGGGDGGNSGFFGRGGTGGTGGTAYPGGVNGTNGTKVGAAVTAAIVPLP